MLSELQRRKLTRIFKLLDADANGSLHEKDIMRVSDRLAARRSLAAKSAAHAHVREEHEWLWVLLRPSDANQDHKITLEEWLRHHADLFESKHLEPFLRARVGVLFNILDANRDAAITADEYAMLLSAHGVDEAWARANFQRLDASSAGRLSKDEVYGLLREFFISDDPSAPGNTFWGPY
jgi:Ca2+-binding EF-hand superfamily protein